MRRRGAYDVSIHQASYGVGILPCEYEPCPGFNERKARQDNPVHKPWCQLRWIRGTEGLVGSEDGEEDSDDRSITNVLLVYARYWSCWDDWKQTSS